ncbi:uncharacterized protein LOC132043708, partial [Lycium ferocissimum]|uniref:uncharacterized protein LOC132043708 n=1 Tax=Lycium ferocissimum TaxID=112874 RepID=UPI002814BA40
VVFIVVALVNNGRLGSCSRLGTGMGVRVKGGRSTYRNGVGILVDSELRGQVVELKRVNDRIMAIKLIIRGSTLNIVITYALQEGLDEEDKKHFWDVLDKVLRAIPLAEKLFIGRDFNGHIGLIP